MNDVVQYSAKSPARVLIVDDHPIVRRGVVDLLQKEQDLKVCGEASTVDDAMNQIRASKPDVIVLDLTLEGIGGLELIKQVRALDENIRILVSSMHDESIYAERVLRAGGMGYVAKQEAPEKLVEGIRQVLSGRVRLSDTMTERLLRRTVGGGGRITDGTPSEVLSDRELEVFRLIGDGHTTRQISEVLTVTVKTVESHRENIKNKLSLSNAAELSRRAVQFVLEGR